jgi:hypothetical protein
VQANKILLNEQLASNTLKLVVSKNPKNVILTEENNERKAPFSPSMTWEEKNNMQNSYAISSSRATAL